MNMRHVAALGMLSLALLVSFTHDAWAQGTVQTAYTFSCTQDAVRIDPLCLGALSESRVTVLSMVNLCRSPSSFVLVSGRGVMTALTVPPNQQTPAPRMITVPVGWVLAIRTNPMGCTQEEGEDGDISCLNVTSTIQFNEPPMFCRRSQ
jgi:hypothetical protein